MLTTSKSPKRRATRLRDRERTRQRLLQAAFREVYRYGFQSAGIDAILASTNVTKGALYYHFNSKEALGHAVIEEVVAKLSRERWLLPLQRRKDQDPIDALIAIVQAIPTRPRDIKGGCPLVSLAQEMYQLDDQFRKAISENLPCLARKQCHGFAEGTASGNCPPRLGSGRGYELSGRDRRRPRSLGKDCSRCEGVEYRN